MAKWLIFFAMAIVLGVPFAVRPPESRAPKDAQRLVIITPHVEPIRIEFARVFDEWHRATFNQSVVIDWRVPGGTSDIQKQLKAIYQGAIASGQLTPAGELARGFAPLPFDLFFGGGTFEHNETKKGVTARPANSEKDVTLSMSISAGFPQQQLDAWFGKNELGAGFLYDPGNRDKGDPGQYWIGTAASGFGIVYNRDILCKLGMPDPTRWEELCDAKLIGWVALADPRQSGSVATLYDSILNNYGWERGWKILRRMAANSRTFTNSSPKVPLDVSQGEAAMGVAISHYGRFQAQAVMKPGETPENSRVGYIDPPGVVYIDADPISLMRGGPNPEIAKRFIEFCLSDPGQALWQFHTRPASVTGVNDTDAGTWGPTQYELRRMAVKRDLFEKFRDRMVDKTSPFEAASTVKEKGWRSAVGPMMGAFGIDTHAELIRAWSAYNRAKDRGVSTETLARMEALLDSLPDWDMNGQPTPFNDANYKAIREDWRKAERDGRMPGIRAGWIRFFRGQYAEVERLAASGG
ncbi:MAG: ABC transporter substrate-binding protein [Phycisphaerales bacterium]